jgi:hypothetical protein
MSKDLEVIAWLKKRVLSYNKETFLIVTMKMKVMF